jgi:hypothetical protein
VQWDLQRFSRGIRRAGALAYIITPFWLPVARVPHCRDAFLIFSEPSVSPAGFLGEGRGPFSRTRGDVRKTKEDAMSDPRFDPRLSDPVERRPDTSGGMWGWIAGIAVVVLIAIILIAGWNSNPNTASNAPSATTGSATAPMSSPLSPRPATPPSTTGSAPRSAPTLPSPTPAPAPSRP